MDIPAEIRSMIPPPFYISQLGSSLVIWGSVISDNMRIVCGWSLNGGLVSDITHIFMIWMPTEHVPKLLGFTKREEPIFEVSHNQQGASNIQVWNNNLQIFENLMGVDGNGGSVLIGPYKESLILLTNPSGQVLN